MTKTPTIYIVDDDRHTRILLAAQLKKLGVIRDFANALLAQEAIEKEGFPDLIVTDIDMPGLNGLEFLRWIQQQNEEVAVLVVSAYHSDGNIFKALEMGATDFICKPFPLRNITQAAKNALKCDTAAGQLEIKNYGQWISFVFDSDFEYLRRINNLISTLIKKKYNEKVCHDIKLAIEEIGANAIEWGNKNDPNLKVTIKYRLFDTKILIWIEDQGAGFKNLGLPASPEELQGQRKEDGKREGGYGINMVQNIMNEVVYNLKGNSVVMSLSLDDNQKESEA